MMQTASLKVKLRVGFGLMMVILVTQSAVDYVSMKKISRFSALDDAAAENAYRARTIEALINSRKTDIRSFLLSGSEEHINQYQEHNRGLADEFSALDSRLTAGEDRNLFAELQHAADANDRSAQHVAALKRTHKMRAASDELLGSEMSAQRAEMERTLADLTKRYRETVASTREKKAQAEAGAIRGNIVFAMIGMVISLFAATLIPRYFSSNISRMLAVIEQIAAKNLAIDDAVISSEDEIGKAGGALNVMKNNLRELIQSIARTAEQVASASEELSSSASQQAQSAETQKGQAAQVSVAMQEMSTTVGEVSENSTRAAQAARQAAETAREGGAIVEESLTKMRGIAESVSATAQKVEELGRGSDQIGRIIGVIDDIADQTNLLALNAAIEAARAGEQGRGFAVVADEVRKLAERTTSATKEVAQMVQGIQTGTKTAVAAMREGTRQVQDGVTTTARAGDSLKQIIQMSEEVGEMITHIATAATEQSAAAEQVNQNAEQITRLTGESALGAQQSAHACQDLSALALDLQKMVSNFKLEGTLPSAKNSLRRPDWHPEKFDLAEETKTFAATAG
jgi:methyl-accepting chemotaxis protein